VERRRVHILGASGSGVSTLGRAVARAKRWSYFDTDDFYWQPTDPPFVVKRPPSDRVERLLGVATPGEARVLGGALDGWGDALIERFDLVVFLRAPTELRIDRLRERERRRFGRRVGEGGDMDDHHQRFLAWAASYDDATLTSGLRSRARHEAWLAMLPHDPLRLDATRSVDALTRDVLQVLSLGSRRSA
jgi:adenylate kinase family enzyme